MTASRVPGDRRQVKITAGKAAAHLAAPLMNSSKLIVLHFEREDDVVVEAEPDVGGAPSRVEVANYLDVGVAHHLAMSARELEREHLLASHSRTAFINHVRRRSDTYCKFILVKHFTNKRVAAVKIATAHVAAARGSSFKRICQVVPWSYMNQRPNGNGIAIGSAVFARAHDRDQQSD